MIQSIKLYLPNLVVIRDCSLITSRGGGGVGGYAGGYNFKTSLFSGVKFFTGKKHKGGSNCARNRFSNDIDGQTMIRIKQFVPEGLFVWAR